MATEPENQAAAPRRFRFGWQYWVFSTAVAIVLLLFAALAWLDTGAGHRFVVARVAALSPSSGLKIRIGRIEGSIYKNAVLQDVRLYDNKGLFMYSPRSEAHTPELQSLMRISYAVFCLNKKNPSNS